MIYFALLQIAARLSTTIHWFTPVSSASSFNTYWGNKVFNRKRNRRRLNLIIIFTISIW